MEQQEDMNEPNEKQTRSLFSYRRNCSRNGAITGKPRAKDV